MRRLAVCEKCQLLEKKIDLLNKQIEALLAIKRQQEKLIRILEVLR